MITPKLEFTTNLPPIRCENTFKIQRLGNYSLKLIVDSKKETLRIKIILTIWILLTPFLVFSQETKGEIEADIRKQIDKILAHDVEVDSEETPGCLIGIIDVDTFFVLAYGKRADRSGIIEKTDKFDIGGLSKIFISPVCTELIQKGIFQYTDSLISDFPEFVDNDMANVTFGQLLQHESGIKKILIGLEANTQEDNIQPDVFFKHLQSNIVDDRKKFQYSHHNYALLSIWVERRTGKSFDVLLNDFLKKQMPNDPIDIQYGQEKLQSHFSGLSKGGALNKAKLYGTHEYSQGMQATIFDLIKYAQGFWMDETNPIAQEALSNKSETGIRNKLQFSNSFYVMENKKYTIYTHSGRSTRHTAALHFVPETRTGVVVVSNSEIGTKDLSLLVLRMINHNWKRKPYE